MKRISLKLFLSFMLVVITVLSILALVQFLFLERYYNHKITVDLESKLNNIIHSKENNNMDSLKLASSISVLDGFRDSIINLSEVEIKSRKIVTQKSIIIKPGIDKSSTSVITASVIISRQSSITKDGSADGTQNQYSVMATSDTDIEMQSDSGYDEILYRQQLKLDEFYKKDPERFLSGRLYSYFIKDKSKISYCVNIAYIKNGKGSYTLIVLSPIDSIKKAFFGAEGFYLYDLLSAGLAGILLSYILCRIITKPIKKMSLVVSKMAMFDFSERCSIHTHDELESLSESINSLSDNLISTMQQLKTSNESLEKEQENKKSLEDMLKGFASDVSHELKTPISIMKGYLEVYIDSLEKGVVKKGYLDVINEEVVGMELLVQDMLDLSRLEAENAVINIELFSIDQLIEYCCSKNSMAIKKKKISLFTNYSDENILVYGDSLKIEHVITNIMNNAIKFTPTDGFIKISIEPDSSDVKVQIENSGSYINENDIDKIWDKFYRVDKSRSKKAGGTGLGLSIVRKILELHQSTYGVKNTSDGVLFYFTLKVQKIKTNFSKL